MTTDPVSSDQQTWAALAYYSAVIQFVSLPSFLGPLFVWLAKRSDPVVEPHAREALNYHRSRERRDRLRSRGLGRRLTQ